MKKRKQESEEFRAAPLLADSRNEISAKKHKVTVVSNIRL